MSFLSYKFPWSRSAPVMGLDIDAAGLRLIELSGTNSQLRVNHFAFEPIAPGALREGSVQQFDLVSEALHIAIVKSGSVTREVALALPSSSVISKMVTLPDLLSEEDIEAEIQAEASQNLPFAMSDMGLDFYILGPSSREQASVDVMLVAARKEKIDERVAIAQAAGLQVVAINVDSYAARFAISHRMKREKLGKNNAIGLYQIGSEQSQFSILFNRIAVYERELAFGSQKLKQDLQRYGDEMHGELIRAFNEMLAQELSRSLQLFFSSSAYTHIDHLFLAGDTSHLAQLEQLLVEKIDIPVRLANPFLGMKLAAAVNQSILEIQAPSCLVAAGLALSRIEI